MTGRVTDAQAAADLVFKTIQRGRRRSRAD